MDTISSVLPASQARANFYDLLDEVSDKLRRFTITLRGKVKAVIMPADQVEAWEETLEIMSNKKLSAAILRSEKERKQGKVISEKALLKELGISPMSLKQ